MKFEQAFYTSDRNQLSRYKEGLGICAASNHDTDFLDNCLGLGSVFGAEQTERTAEFVLYSKDFKTFVGVGISPRESIVDGRVNMLCHFFIPTEKGPNKNIEECLVSFPFRREIDRTEEFNTVELEKTSFEYYDILEKYNMHGEEGKYKLARLLFKAYPCILGENDKLFCLIDRGKHNMDEDTYIAREMLWLLSVLAPKGNDNVYLERLSYGVHTSKNTNPVTFVFTDMYELGSNRFFVDVQDKGEDIPEVFIRLAECAQNSSEEFHRLLNEILLCGENKKIQTSKLGMNYLRWKINNGFGIAYEEISDDLKIILNTVDRNQWYRDFALEYFVSDTENRFDIDILVMFWTNLIQPLINECEVRTEAEKQNIIIAACKAIQLMYPLNSNNSRIFARRIKVYETKKAVLELVYSEENNIIDIELQNVESIENLKEHIATFGVLKGNEKYDKKLLDKAMALYGRVKSQKRSDITEIMESGYACEWRNKVNSYLAKYDSVSDYVEFLQNEIDKIEPYFATNYYHHLLMLFKDTKEFDERILEYKEQFHHKFQQYLSETDVMEFEEAEALWTQKRINRQLINMELSELAYYDIGDIKAYDESKNIWLSCICNKIEKTDEIEEKVYGQLLEQIKNVHLIDFNNVLLEPYEEFIWAKVKTNVERRMRFQLYKIGADFESKYTFWNDIKEDDFEKIDTLVSHDGMLRQVINKEDDCEKGELIRRCYITWENINKHEKSILCIRLYNYESGELREFLKMFIRNQKNKIVNFDKHNINDICNYISLQMMEGVGCQNQCECAEEYRYIYSNHRNFVNEIIQQRGRFTSNDRDMSELYSNMADFLIVQNKCNEDKLQLRDTLAVLKRIQNVFGKEFEFEYLQKECEGMIESLENRLDEIEKKVSSMSNIQNVERIVERIDKLEERVEGIESKRKDVEVVIDETGDMLTQMESRQHNIIHKIIEDSVQEKNVKNNRAEECWNRPNTAKHKEVEELPKYVSENLGTSEKTNGGNVTNIRNDIGKKVGNNDFDVDEKKYF